MLIKNEYNIGDFVYIKTDPHQERGIITGIILSPGTILYRVSIKTSTNDFYEFELSSEVDELIKVTS